MEWKDTFVYSRSKGMRLQVFKGEDKKWRLCLRALNNRIVMESKPYSRRAKAWETAISIIQAGITNVEEVD